MRYTKTDQNLWDQDLRWDVPARHQGQTVEVAFATPGTRYEQDTGAVYKRVTNLSKPVGSPGRVTYYVRADAVAPGEKGTS